jgi:hypothetical protein
MIRADANLLPDFVDAYVQSVCGVFQRYDWY